MLPTGTFVTYPFWRWFPFAALTAFALPGRRFWFVFMGICTGVRVKTPGSKSPFQRISKMLEEVEVSVLCRPAKFFRTHRVFVGFS